MYKNEKERVIIKSEGSKKSYIKTMLVTYSIGIVFAMFFGLLPGGLEAFLGLILLCSLPVCILVHLITYKLYKDTEIVVTNYGIYCKNYFKDETFITLNSITSVSTYSEFMNSIAFTCINNTYYCCYIRNRQEIYDTVNKLISQSHPCSETAEIFYKLLKYKSLYDEGVITSEEFTLKKKQLLEI